VDANWKELLVGMLFKIQVSLYLLPGNTWFPLNSISYSSNVSLPSPLDSDPQLSHLRNKDYLSVSITHKKQSRSQFTNREKCYCIESAQIINNDMEFRELLFNPDFSLKQAGSPITHSWEMRKAFIAQCLKSQVKASVSKIQQTSISRVVKTKQHV
jgi:hypothetical protein